MAKLKIDNTGAQYISATKPQGGSPAPRARKGTDLRTDSTRSTKKSAAKPCK